MKMKIAEKVESRKYSPFPQSRLHPRIPREEIDFMDLIHGMLPALSRPASIYRCRRMIHRGRVVFGLIMLLPVIYGSFSLSPSPVYAQAIWHVDDDALNDPGPGDPAVSDPEEDGSAEHPFDAIQEGINAASNGDTVLVAQGTYKGGRLPDANRNRDLEFLGKGITLRSESGPEVCIIDCEGRIEDPHRGISFQQGEGENATLMGFTIKNGYVFGPSFRERCGGGIYISDASPLITYNIIKENKALYGFEVAAGGGIFCDGGAPVIINNTIRLNEAGWHGGGIACYNGASPNIMNNLILGNQAFCSHGGGIFCYNQSCPVIQNNIIELNEAGWHGGGIGCGKSTSQIRILNNTIRRNKAEKRGGGIYCSEVALSIMNNLFFKNEGLEYGGGIFGHQSTIKVENNTFNENDGGSGGGGVCTEDSPAVTLRNSILWDDTPEEIHSSSADPLEVRYCDVEGGCPGEGNIADPPLFTGIPLGGRHYLSHEDAGQEETSPCVDAGDPDSKFFSGTTRTDMEGDMGPIDMGYHYPLPGLVLGPGPKSSNPAHVRVFPGQWSFKYSAFEFDAYASQYYGVNLTCGDVDRDGFDEIIAGAGPGPCCGPRVRGFQVDGKGIPGLDFLAYGTHAYGVNVGTGDIMEGDSFHEILTITGPGPFMPHVRAYQYDADGSVQPLPRINFRAYGTPSFGVNISGGDIDGDHLAEIITGAGPGPAYGPHVRGWNSDGNQITAMPGVSFFADSRRTHGVDVTCGDVDRDGFDEICTAPGPAEDMGAQVRVWDYDCRPGPPTQIFSLKAFPKIKYGARIYVSADFNKDGFHDLVVGAGPDPLTPALVKVFGYTRPYRGVSEWISFQAFPPTWTCGAVVAAGRF